MPKKYYHMADPKAHRLEISGPGLRFVVIYRRPVRTKTGMRISGLVPATEMNSDRPEFIVWPVSCKRIKRNVCMEADTNSCRSAALSLSQSHVNIR